MGVGMRMSKAITVLAIVLAMVLLIGCTREVIKEVEVPVEVTKEVVVEKIVEKEVIVEKQPEQEKPTPAAIESDGPKVYQLGIFEDLTTTNYWSYLGPNGTIWNSYVLGGKPSLYSLSAQRFDYVPSVAEDFSTPLKEETVDGTTLWTTEVPLKQGVKWSDGNDVTAHDFVFTAHTVLDLELTGNWSSVVDPKFFDHAEALDDYR